jgi:hypothetical protein
LSSFTSLEKPEYLEVLLSLLRGNSYSSSISKDLGKAQPTVSEELKALEAEGIISKVKRTKAQSFAVNEERLVEIIFEELEVICSIPRIEISSNFPKTIMIDFLTTYANLPGIPQSRSIKDIFSSFVLTLSLLNTPDSETLRIKWGLGQERMALLLSSAYHMSTRANSWTFLTLGLKTPSEVFVIDPARWIKKVLDNAREFARSHGVDPS